MQDEEKRKKEFRVWNSYLITAIAGVMNSGLNSKEMTAVNEDLQDGISEQYRKTAIVAAIMLVVLFIIYLINKGVIFKGACVSAAIVVGIQVCKLFRLSEPVGDRK